VNGDPRSQLDASDTEALIVHVRSLQDRAAKWQETVWRAERGLAFANEHIAMLGPDVDPDLPALRYWVGKREAYTITLEYLNGAVGA
jgi:hypothetical protein